MIFILIEEYLDVFNNIKRTIINCKYFPDIHLNLNWKSLLYKTL